MQIVGDEQGIRVLDEMRTTSKDYLKFLVQEARTVFGNRVVFKSSEGDEFELVWSPQRREFSVLRK